MPTLSAKEIAAVAAQAGFKGRDLTVAIAVCYGESGGNPDSVNHNKDSRRTTDYGLWQINSYWQADKLRTGSWSNPVDNARMAYAVYVEAGRKFTPWYAYKNGSYLAFMPKASAAASQVGNVSKVESPPTEVAPQPPEAASGNDYGIFPRVLLGMVGILLVAYALLQVTGAVNVKGALSALGAAA